MITTKGEAILRPLVAKPLRTLTLRATGFVVKGIDICPDPSDPRFGPLDGWRFDLYGMGPDQVALTGTTRERTRILRHVIEKNLPLERVA